MKKRVGVLLGLLVFFAIHGIADAEWNTNKGKVRGEIEAGGWRVAYGDEFDIKDFAEASVVGYYGGPVGLKIWAESLAEESCRKMGKEVQAEFGGDVQKIAVEFSESVLKDLLKEKSSGWKVRTYGNVEFKTGVARYTGANYVDGNPTGYVPSLQPYVGLRFKQESEQLKPKTDPKPITGEWVTISNMVNGRCLDADERNTGKDGCSIHGEPVVLHKPNQQWKIVEHGDRVYSIQCRSHERIIDADEGYTNKDGCKIHLCVYAGKNNQRWLITENEDGSFTIVCEKDGKVLDMNDGTAYNPHGHGDIVHLINNAGKPNQRWYISR